MEYQDFWLSLHTPLRSCSPILSVFIFLTLSLSAAVLSPLQKTARIHQYQHPLSTFFYVCQALCMDCQHFILIVTLWVIPIPMLQVRHETFYSVFLCWWVIKTEFQPGRWQAPGQTQLADSKDHINIPEIHCTHSWQPTLCGLIAGNSFP